MAVIVTRTSKGTALTTTELDANFTNLNTELASKILNTANPTFTGVVTFTDPTGIVPAAVDYPAAAPSLMLDFLNTEKLDSRVTFTRASSATRINAAGLVETMAANLPRFDYDPVSGAPKGLLIEEARTNSLLYSEQFESGSSNTVNINVTANSITSPAGTTTADLLTDNTTAGVEHYVEKAIALYTNQAYTQSVYVKAGTAASFVFTVVAVGSSNATSNVTFTQTGGVYAPAIFSSQIITSAAAIPVGNGWYRCSVVYTLNGTVTYHALRIYPYLGGVYTGTEIGHYFWGAQLEAGAFPTSYIPTTTAAATRVVDTADLTNINSWYNQTEWSIFAQYDSLYSGSVTTNGQRPHVWGLNNSTLSGFDGYGLVERWDTTTRPAFHVRHPSSSITSIALANYSAYITAGQVYKAVTAMNSSQLAVTVNNKTVVTITNTGYGISTQNRLQIGFGDTGGSSPYYLNGHIQRLAYYPTRLTDAEMQLLST